MILSNYDKEYHENKQMFERKTVYIRRGTLRIAVSYRLLGLPRPMLTYLTSTSAWR